MKNKRLSFRLLIGLSLTALCVWCIATAVAWTVVKKEAKDVFNAQQVLFAERLATSDLKNVLLDENANFPRGGFKPQKRHYDNDALAFAIFSNKGERLLTDGDNGDKFIFQNKTGFSKEHILDDDDEWLIYWQPVGKGELVIAVGQELEYREELVNKMVFSQTGIWFAGLPILLLVAFIVIYRALKPINRLSRNVQARRPGDVSLLETDNVPTEILPLVQNLNQFFTRTSEQLERERRFVSDAAHELRSPLAALRIQTEVAQLAGDDAQTRETALAHLTQGIDRATQLIEQLLTLSRLDNLKELNHQEPIDWSEIITSLIGELYFSAQQRQIELQFEHQGDPAVKQGQPLLLAQMLRNLLDNAIKYCPQGTLVRVILQPRKIFIEDNGSGVAPEELAKLGQRFYRPAGQNEKGSGLGLSIVARIAELHHYRFRLDNIEANGQIQGLRAIIEL